MKIEEKPSSGSGTITRVVDQVYDMYNRWIGRIVDPDGNQGSLATQATYFAYDQGQIVLEFTGSTADSLLTRYLWSPAVDRLLAEEAHVKQGINSGDITFAFQAGEYDDGDNNNSGWAEGDWNGDKEFNQADFNFVSWLGTYE